MDKRLPEGVAVAVLRAPPRPSADSRGTPCGHPRSRGVALRAPSVDKRCCRCRSPCPSAALRGRPSVDKRCCRCRSPRPSAALRGQKVFGRGTPCGALRGQKASELCNCPVLPAPPRPFVDKRCSSFSAPLRGPPWTKGVAVAVLRAPPRPSVCCRCRAWTKGVAVAVLRPSAALPKGVAVAVGAPLVGAVLRAPPGKASNCRDKPTKGCRSAR